MDRAALIAGVAVVLALVAPTSHAFVQYKWPRGVQIKAATNGVPVVSGALAQIASAAAGGGAAALRANQALRIGADASAALSLSRTVPLANLARVARIASGVLGPVALVGLAYEGLVWVSDHWETEETVPDASGLGIEWYGYVSPNGSTKYGAGSTPLEACNAYVSGPSGYGAGYYCVRTGGDDKPNDLSSYCQSSWCADGTFTFKNPSGGTVGSNQSVYYKLSPCNAGATRDPDTGVCMLTGQRAATDPEVEAAISTALQAEPSKAGQVLDESLAVPAALSALQPDPQVVTGPATVPGPSTQRVVVGPEGTTTHNSDVQYNLSYTGDVVTVTSTVTTVTVHPDSSTTTETSDTAAPPGDPASEEDAPKDECEEHPDRVGCADLGDPEDFDLPEQDRSMSWAPAFSASGSCPSDKPFTVGGRSFSMSWVPVCDLATGVRPVIIAVAWLSAAVFVFGASRKAT